MQATPDPIISFRNVNKVYDDGTVGLKAITFDIPRGQFLVVVGLSGAGKSTLLRTINRLHEISSGEIRIDNEPISSYKGKNLRQLRCHIGMIFQNFNLVKRSSVEKNVLSGLVGVYPTWRCILGLFSPQDKQRAFQALERVSLTKKVFSRADQLSGGQQQRVAIARTLMQNPKIILADEPVASLDPRTTRDVMDTLQQLNKEDGITVIVNLHSVALAQRYADRIIGLRNGELVYDEAIANVTPEALNEIYQNK